MDRSFSKQDRRFILRVSSTYRATIATATGTIPVDPSDDAGDGGGISQGVSPASRTTDPNGHTPVGFRLDAVHRTRHLQSKENHRHRTGYVDNSLPRVPAHTHCATATVLSLRISMVDPLQSSNASDAMASQDRQVSILASCEHIARDVSHDRLGRWRREVIPKTGRYQIRPSWSVQ
jgi:hypothetical protein